VQDALDHRDLGILLGLIIQYSGLSQHSLGAEIGMSQTQVWHYLHDRHKPTLDTIDRVATRLAVPPLARRRLGLSPAAGQPRSAPPRVRLSKILALAEYIGRTGDTSGLATSRDTTSTDSPADTWEDLYRVISVQAPPTLRAAERVSVRTRGFYLIAANLPARLVIQALTAHVNDIGLLLDAVSDPAQRRDLTSACGEASYLAACCNVDLGDLPGALNLLDVISAAADGADDPALAAMALDGQSHFHAFRGHHDRALHLVEQGRDTCSSSGSPGTVAYLWLRVAEEHVALGHTTDAARAWGHAEDSYTATSLETERNWVRLWLSRDCFESVRAVLYSATGRAEEAIAVSERVLTRLTGALGKADAIAVINAATALATAGQFAPAAEAGRHALQAARTAEASGCLPRAHTLARLLSVQMNPPAAGRAFLDDLDATQRKLDGLKRHSA
jgi:transcriptional regulator with XRE-family HTH domain